MGLKPNPYPYPNPYPCPRSYCSLCLVNLYVLLHSTLSSFSALMLLVGSFNPQKPVPDMTCNVFGGTLNLS